MKDLPIEFPDILLPNKGVNLSKWAVVACDQFTSNEEYWNTLDNYVGDKPSTLRLVIPEIYLSEDNDTRIEAVNRTMQSYLEMGVFDTYQETAVLVRRCTPHSPARSGLVVAIDLEDYSFVSSDKALIRATEGTILERIPPRVQIRKTAPLELPHIMLLIDDPEKTVIEPLLDEDNELIYQFQLNKDGGSISGYKVREKMRLVNALTALTEPSRLAKRYSGEKLLFAVGDGNHSLAAAKVCWEHIKSTLLPEQQANHPARFALCEICNIYDDGIVFEPIHRAIFNVEPKDFLDKFIAEFSHFEGRGTIIFGGVRHSVPIDTNAIEAVKAIQQFCNEYAEANSSSVDYIHGDEECNRIGCKDNALVIVLPKMNKSDLFPYIVQNGVLPRKMFSMGEGNEKRYYLEARKIR